MLAASVVAGIAMLVLALAFFWRAHDQEQLRELARSNCEQIEALKAVVRPELFDLVQTRMLLRDLNIDPDSEQGQRLIEQARSTTARERRELAPTPC